MVTETKSVEKRMGYCSFCGQGGMVTWVDGYVQEDLDRIATYGCNCEGATRQRNKETQLDECLANIDELVAKNYQDLADILYECVRKLQDEKIQKVSVSNGEGVTATLTTTQIGKIKLKLSKKDDWEVSA